MKNKNHFSNYKLFNSVVKNNLKYFNGFFSSIEKEKELLECIHFDYFIKNDFKINTKNKNTYFVYSKYSNAYLMVYKNSFYIFFPESNSAYSPKYFVFKDNKPDFYSKNFKINNYKVNYLILINISWNDDTSLSHYKDDIYYFKNPNSNYISYYDFKTFQRFYFFFPIYNDFLKQEKSNYLITITNTKKNNEIAYKFSLQHLTHLFLYDNNVNYYSKWWKPNHLTLNRYSKTCKKQHVVFDEKTKFCMGTNFKNLTDIIDLYKNKSYFKNEKFTKEDAIIIEMNYPELLENIENLAKA